MKKLGKYTKEELFKLENMYQDGFTIYKIARDLRRSQKSVKNNLIRLGLINRPTETYIGSNEITSTSLSNQPRRPAKSVFHASRLLRGLSGWRIEAQATCCLH